MRQKDNDAFSYLYDHYAGALYGVIRQIIPNEEEASDVLQEVFVSVWRKIDQYDTAKGRLFTWMLHIARNAAIDRARSKGYQNLKRQDVIDNDLHQLVVRPGFDDYGLKKVLFKLKDEQRELIDLAYYHGYTHEQIAKALSIPLGTVKTRIRSALLQLRQLLS